MEYLDTLNNEMAFTSELLSKSALFFSEEELEIISNKTIAQAGFGGIGAMVMELLARWGVKRFRLLDMDQYEISNMNRQVFATVKTLGQYKAKVAAERIKEINPFAEIEQIHCEKLNHQNVKELVENADIIINGADLPSGTLLFHHYAQKYRVPMVNGSCHEVTGGLIRVFDYRLPKQQSLYEPTKIKWVNNFLYKHFGIVKNEIENIPEDKFSEIDKRLERAGTLNFLTNLLACLITAETIKLLVNKGKRVLYPKEIYINLFDLKMRVRSSYNRERIFNYLKRIITRKDVNIHNLTSDNSEWKYVKSGS
jgi:tRNA A37 threonylcarbamoyladenosine dehydratase